MMNETDMGLLILDLAHQRLVAFCRFQSVRRLLIALITVFCLLRNTVTYPHELMKVERIIGLLTTRC